MSHSAENLRRESFTVAVISCTEKVWRRGGGGVSGFSIKIFLSHSVENFRRGILYCCINFRWRKSLWTRGGKEVSRFSIEKFFSHTAENLRGESFAVGLNSGTQKVWIRGVSIKIFRQKCFSSHSAEIFPREYFLVAIISRTEKVWRRGGVSIKIFRQKFLSHTAENLRREYFFVALISGTEKIWGRRGEDQEFPSKLSFVSQSRKFSLGIHYCCNNFAYRKSLEKRRGGVSRFSIKNFCLTLPKISVRNTLLLH